MLEPKGKHSQGQQKDLHQLSCKEVKHKDPPLPAPLPVNRTANQRRLQANRMAAFYIPFPPTGMQRNKTLGLSATHWNGLKGGIFVTNWKSCLTSSWGFLNQCQQPCSNPQSITGSTFINRSSKVWCQLHLVSVWNKMGSCIHLEQQEAGVLGWARWAQLPFAAGSCSDQHKLITGYCLQSVFEKKLSCSTWGLFSASP